MEFAIRNIGIGVLGTLRGTYASLERKRPLYNADSWAAWLFRHKIRRGRRNRIQMEALDKIVELFRTIACRAGRR